jgi:hypothetical protein
MEDNYLEELREKLEKKNLTNFWINLESKKFKPLNYTKDEILEGINENLDKYIDKKFAHIRIGIKKNIKDYSINHDNVFSIRIVIYTITKKGNFSNNTNHLWGCLIKYDLFDILERKFSLEDLKIILENTNDQVLVSDGITGMTYDKMIKLLKKSKVKF